MASVSAADVRDVVNAGSDEVPDVKVLKMVKRAEVTLEREDHPQPCYSKQVLRVSATIVELTSTLTTYSKK